MKVSEREAAPALAERRRPTPHGENPASLFPAPPPPKLGITHSLPQAYTPPEVAAEGRGKGING